MPSTLSQAFPPSPTFTETSLPNLQDRVFLITGAAAGIGYELAKILYSKNGTVYIAARSSERVSLAIGNIAGSAPTSKGRLAPLILDLADFPTVKRAAEGFLEKEERLDVLVHNAGVMTPPVGSKSKLGHDLEMATNCLGPFLLNHSLEPLLIRTAQTNSRPDTVRIVWLSSIINVSTPTGGVLFDETRSSPKVLKNVMQNYMQTKVGNVFLASEAAKRLGRDGVISVSVNPGLMKTELQRHNPRLQGIVMGLLFKPPLFGAYSELFAALSPSVTAKRNGAFIVPWGRFGEIPGHIEKGLRTKAEGGSGAAWDFWDWCKKETEPYW